MHPIEVVLCYPVRTAIGTYSGSLKEVPAPDLGAAVIRETLKRSGLSADKVQTLVMGNRDRKKPHGPSLPHHRTYGSRIRRFLETSLISCCLDWCQFGQPHLTKHLCRQCQV
jgi:acetyl-CoA acetyltransferase